MFYLVNISIKNTYHVRHNTCVLFDCVQHALLTMTLSIYYNYSKKKTC